MLAGGAAAPVTAGSAQTSAERQGLATSLESPLPPADSLLLAVLSLEAATTTDEVESSLQRILSLGLPQETLATANLTELPSEVDDHEEDAEDAAGEDGEDLCKDAGHPAYCVYTVVEGDTLSAIATTLGFTSSTGITAAEMLAQSNKPDVASSDHIEPGQNIRVPRETGILHTVFAAETASDLASDYGVPLDAILDSSYNAVGSDGVLFVGQEVFIPDPAQLPVNEEVELTLEEPASQTETPEATPTGTSTEPTPTEPAVEPTPTEEPVTVPEVPLLGPLATPTPEATEEPTATPEPDEDAEDEEPDASGPNSGGSSFFVWPAQGPISSYFGPSHPLGIDIDLYNDPDARIVASRGGRVVFAGGDPCCSYGLYVIIEHENGVSTLYAHLSEILVSEGEQVEQGELIGRGGHTGYATGNHLHFEMRVDGNVVDPMRYLP